MTPQTIPDRLLADDELLNRLFAESNNFALREDVRALMAEAHNAIVEAAALSAPEGDMARALEWVRAMVGDNAGSRMHLPAIEEAIATYDPERAGAFSGTTPQPGDGVVEANALSADELVELDKLVADVGPQHALNIFVELRAAIAGKVDEADRSIAELKRRTAAPSAKGG